MLAYRELLQTLAEEIGAPSYLLLDAGAPVPDLCRTPGPRGLVSWHTSDPDLAELLALRARSLDAIDEVRVVAMFEGTLIVARVGNPPPTPPARPPTRRSAPDARKCGPSPPRPTASARTEPAPPRTEPAPPRSPDARPVAGSTLDHLEPLLLARLGPDPIAALLGLGAAYRRGRGIVPTVAAVLALGQHPASWILGSPLVATAEGHPLRVVGPLPDVLRALDGWSPIARSAETARLLVLHATLTRDWSEDAEALPTTLEANPDGLEVRFPRATAENAILRALCERLGLPEPASELARLGITVSRSIRANTVHLRAPWPARSRKRPYLALADREELLLAHLRAHGARSTRELVGALGWSRAVVRAVIASLLDDGRVEGTEGGRQAPGQRYRLTGG